MGKMKIMAFFKNPIAKNITMVLVALIVVCSIVAIPISNAGSQINVDFRATSMKVSAGGKDILIPELSPKQPKQASNTSKYTGVFCIDEGKNLSVATYKSEYNAYNRGESSKYFTNYGAALWLFDNMYIENGSNREISLNHLAELVTSPEVSKNVSSYGNVTASDIKALNKTVGGKNDSYGNTVNRNFIEVIEQLVLWNYTKNTARSIGDSAVNGGFSGANISSSDQNAAKYLYFALKYLANKNSNYSSNGVTSSTISLDSSRARIDAENKTFGPYTLSSNGVAINVKDEYSSKINATITTADGSTSRIDARKLVVNQDGSFYYDISGYGNVTKATISIDNIYDGATTYVDLMVSGKSQNLVNIRKSASTKSLSDEKSVTYTGKYSIKLVKTKEDGSTAITNNPAKFTVSGSANLSNQSTDSNGTLIIAADKVISSASAKESYKIVENTAPNGYIKYDGTITVDVCFKQSGTTYMLDKDNIKVNSDSSNGSVKMNINNDTIEIFVPNKEEERKREIPKVFDLALRKFITKVDGKAVTTSREPVIDAESKTILDSYQTAAYHHTKQALTVNVGSEIEYTLRVYNEGEVDGYAKEITDYLPDGLSFVKIADESSSLYKTDATKDSKQIVIKYNGNNTIKADSIGRILNKENSNVYQEVKLICKVKEGYTGYITNRAEITNYGYVDNSGVWKEAKAINDSDRDSVQNTIKNSLSLNTWYENAKTYSYSNNGNTKNITDYYPGVQDDDDFETVEVKPEVEVKKAFDLSLRKFITNVDGKEITSRIPQVNLTEDFKNGKVTTATYVHPKDPVDVVSGNIVTYTIRIYNEGEESGYVTKVMDDIPDGLEFLPSDELNKKFGWKMYQVYSEKYHVDKVANVNTITYNGQTYVETTDATKADLIVTDYLKDSIIKAYDSKTMQTLDYKDVKVAFKVVEANTSDRIITNYAQITEHKDSKNNTTVVDRDSTPNKWIENDDDQDIEKIKLRYFDLALRKWVTEAIVTENGKVQVTPTGHKAEDDPEDVVKVDLKKSKLSDVVVKFKYSIRVTNQGEIEGYAKEVSDYIPEGLVFKAQDNPDWKEAGNNVVTTDALANTLLQPGESAEVTIILTWVNNEKNMGVKINTAEISKDYNKYQAKDIDSTPANKVPNEDDIDTAPVMLTIKTGSRAIGYIAVVVGFLTVIGAGVYMVKKSIK